MKRLGTIVVAVALCGCGASNAQSGAGTSSAVSASAADGGSAAGDACTAPDGDAGTCQVAADATTVACFETRVSGAHPHR